MSRFRPSFRRKRDRFWKYQAPAIPGFSSEPERWRACGHKIRHDSHAAANDHANRVTPRPGREMSVYRCKFCDRWHVGNKRKRIS